MNIKDFFTGYRNHPIIFVGAGFSMRYLTVSYSWPGLLEKICVELTGDNELYKDLARENSNKDGDVNLPALASRLEEIFDGKLKEDRHGKFKDINDEYYRSDDTSSNLSRFKIFLSRLVNVNELREGVENELEDLTRASKNIASVITTNYDSFIESSIGYNAVIGNDILMSNPYGAVYKIHGCVTRPESIIITDKDYDYFNKKYELIRAQLLSLFIHNPIIFMGYKIGDPNVKKVLKTIFSYIQPKSDVAEKIKSNFLLIERNTGVETLDVVSHDIEVDESGVISINKVSTDNFSGIYKAISELHLPVSVMDIKRAESVFGKIKEGGNIKVKLVGDLESLSNDELVFAIGSVNTIKIHMQTPQEMMENYFDLISNKEIHVVSLLDKFTIQKSSYFPSFGFSTFCSEVKCLPKLTINQKEKLTSYFGSIKKGHRLTEVSIEDIYSKHSESPIKMENVIFFNAYSKTISSKELEDYLRSYENKRSTGYRRLLALYDYIQFSPEETA
ncbi:SIR2 family protein [Rouxiella badensis]|uniref:SIR2 family protein n=1 Tax=Rouxiella badensis TaxID=1646377 RepID=UPI001D13A21B|nr:SIR2 family protein [Rouxiella badensis]MCC3742927.1 SIR2 family protein [Rouxiella badensis]